MLPTCKECHARLHPDCLHFCVECTVLILKARKEGKLRFPDLIEAHCVCEYDMLLAYKAVKLCFRKGSPGNDRIAECGCSWNSVFKGNFCRQHAKFAQVKKGT